ncbi:FtsW/RodA/SpoVE family cell cycle protein [Aeriscardovia aeriphila]|uniref:FtsW/RodA/SpoVE family cell cycle protein n=1 Tax=Aeriscardovia aeriphila TaxID=218139 RepID=UPI003B831BD9
MAGLRTRHILLLLAAIAIGLLAFVQMSLRVTGTVPRQYWLPLGIDIALLVVLEVVIQVRHVYASSTIIPAMSLLALIGITEITRIDYSQRTLGYSSNSGQRQMMWLAVSTAVAIVVLFFLRDYRILRRISYVCMACGLVLLLAPELPVIGREINGARIWIHFGPFSLQPAEFAKLFLAIFFATYLFDRSDQLAVGGKKVLGVRWPRMRDLGPIAVVWVVSLGILVLQHDLGTSLMFFAMFVGMLFVATRRKSWLVIGFVAFMAGVVVAARVFSNFANRVNIWLHPFDPALYQRQYGGTYQVVQGLFGLASGGMLGTGLGNGHPAITPFANSDFIYTSLGEEVGLLGLLLILVLYLVIIAGGFTAGMAQSDGFGKLLAAGLAFSMAFQVFTVVGGITLVIPLTGLTLPYLAAGGSSLMANILLASLVVAISSHANTPRDSQIYDPDTILAQKLQEQLAARAARQARDHQPAVAAVAASAGSTSPSTPETLATQPVASAMQPVAPATSPLTPAAHDAAQEAAQQAGENRADNLGEEEKA